MCAAESWRRSMQKIKCPYCGYEMPLTYEAEAVCRGIFIKCKGRRCGKIFEIKIEPKTK